MLREAFTSVHLSGDAENYELKLSDDGEVVWIYHVEDGDRTCVVGLVVEDPLLADALSDKLQRMLYART